MIAPSRWPSEALALSWSAESISDSSGLEFRLDKLSEVQLLVLDGKEISRMAAHA